MPIAVTTGAFDQYAGLDAASLDIVNGTTGKLSFVRQGLGLSSYDLPSLAVTPVNLPTAMASGDINNDGKADDFATLNEATKNVTVFRQGNLGAFATTTLSTGSALTPRGLVTGQFNGTAAPDLAIISSQPSVNSDLSLLVNSGNGSTWAPWVGGTYTNGVAITASDFNNDGKLDLATSHDYGAGSNGMVTTYTNTSSGSTTSFVSGWSNIYTVGSQPRAIASGDLKDLDKEQVDGDADIVTTTSSGSSVLKNNGTGQFTVTAEGGVSVTARRLR